MKFTTRKQIRIRKNPKGIMHSLYAGMWLNLITLPQFILGGLWALSKIFFVSLSLLFTGIFSAIVLIPFLALLGRVDIDPLDEAIARTVENTTQE